MRLDPSDGSKTVQATNEQQRGDKQIKVAERSKLKRGKDGQRKTTEMDQKIKLQDDYQTTHVSYANWLCVVFGFWGRQPTNWGQLRPPPL
jgi:hypothetical protein